MIDFNDIKEHPLDDEEQEARIDSASFDDVIINKIEESIDNLIKENKKTLGSGDKISYYIKGNLSQEDIRYLLNSDNKFYIFKKLKGIAEIANWNIDISLNENYKLYNANLNFNTKVASLRFPFKSLTIGDELNKENEADFPILIEIIGKMNK